METGIVSETKYSKTRSPQMKTSVFATSNPYLLAKNINNLFAAAEVGEIVLSQLELNHT
jgi:hypothetical protein